MRRSILLMISTIFIVSCRETPVEITEYDYRIPKVLILTTGDGRGEGTVSDGAIIALQAFNRLGAHVRFENRSILWDKENLNRYDIIIAPTLYGYHDADRLYSLTYMSDQELSHLKNWVGQGGVLVIGENFGRNTPDNVDRVTRTGKLGIDEWPLGEVVGVPLQEVDIEGFRLSPGGEMKEVFSDPLIHRVETSEYILLPSDSTGRGFASDSDGIRSWLVWQDSIEGKNYPAVFVHSYGSGHLVYLSISRIVHPALDGGLAGTPQIEKFFEHVYGLALGERGFPIALNPWPNAAQAVLAITLDDGGNLEEYKYSLTSLFPYVDKISLFITGYIPPEIIEWCRSQSQIELENHTFSHPRLRDLGYFETMKEIRKVEVRYDMSFAGFRHPFVVNSFWGMLSLEELGYLFESSIVVDHMKFYGGGLFPYNIQVFNSQGYIRSLDLLEISPLEHDDWYFYGEGVNGKDNYPEFQQKKDAARFKDYLSNFWEEVVVPEKGVMTVVAHPTYSGKNQILLSPVLDLVREVYEADRYWMTSLREIAAFWKSREVLQLKVKERGNTVSIGVDLPEGVSIEGLSLRLPEEPLSVETSDRTSTIREIDGLFYLIFSAENGDRVDVTFK